MNIVVDKIFSLDNVDQYNRLYGLETLLDGYIASGRLRDFVLPTSEYCATKLWLSVPYFNDLLKFETGKTLDEYFQMKRFEAPKKMLLRAENTPAVVARQLGYPNLRMNIIKTFSFSFKTKSAGFKL